ncbi:MAG: hypothetical protein AAF721_33025 [Myxococcota bacterium]
MRHTPDDSKRLLAASQIATVEGCDCGVVHLHLGALTLRLTESSLNALQQTLAEACCELALGGSSPLEALQRDALRTRIPRGQA